jgi:hypothetical protein
MKMKLTDAQMDKLKKHSKEHGGMNSKHMRAMKRMMEDGMSFAKAHREAMRMEDKDPKSKSKSSKGLTEKQKKLPKKLQEGIAKSNLKKKNKSKY